MNPHHVLLVGAGQLGSRHLQALALCTSNIDISVVDPSPHSLAVAKERYEQVTPSASVGDVKYYSSLTQVEGAIDFCVLASSAQNRLAILRELLEHTHVRNILFEKVLFQSGEQLDEAGQLLSAHHVKAWVNCPRRMFSIYQTLKEQLKGQRTMSLSVQGSNWGLACNGIHMIDLWSYLCGHREYVLDTSQLLTRILESKREGYKEVVGTLSGHHDNSRFSLSCIDDEKTPSVSISLETETFEVEIDESQGLCKIQNLESGDTESLDFQMLFQSNLTNLVADSILRSGDCPLTPFDESADLHRPFLTSLHRFINENDTQYHNVCPIT